MAIVSMGYEPLRAASPNKFFQNLQVLGGAVGSLVPDQHSPPSGYERGWEGDGPRRRPEGGE
jgi:hypothetical protein